MMVNMSMMKDVVPSNAQVGIMSMMTLHFLIYAIVTVSVYDSYLGIFVSIDGYIVRYGN